MELLDLLDGVIGNTDRHGGNAIVDASSRVWAIDHGLSFPTRKCPLFVWGVLSGAWDASIGKSIPPELVARLKQFMVDFPEVEKRLGGILEREAIEQMRIRVEEMIATGRFLA